MRSRRGSSLLCRSARWAAAACGALWAQACAVEARPDLEVTSQAIVGGEPATESAWPNVGWLEAGCSATLVHEKVVVFAGHCGRDHAWVYFGQSFEVALDLDAGSASLRDPARYDREELARCAVHPEAAIGSGSDVAFCELVEAAPERSAVPLIAGCETARRKVGAPVTLVGFGFDTLDARGRPGIKRVAQSRIAGLSRELYIGTADAGTCPGDSGGPAFLRASGGLERPSWRLAAVLSSGSAERCGVGQYADVTAVTDWLESESGYDLTPCFDGNDDWRPGPDCVDPPLDAEGEPVDGPGEYASQCGRPFQPAACSASHLGSHAPGASGALWLLLGLFSMCRLRIAARSRPGPDVQRAALTTLREFTLDAADLTRLAAKLASGELVRDNDSVLLGLVDRAPEVPAVRDILRRIADRNDDDAALQARARRLLRDY